MKLTHSKKDWIRRIRQKDKKVVQELYEAHYKPCSAIILRDGGTVEDAREVFQEALFSLLVKAQNPDFSIRSNLKGYLYRTCFNIWVKMKREQRKYESTDKVLNDLPDQDGIPEKQEQEERYLLLNDCIKKASPACQKLLELSYYTDMIDEKIAEAMNYTKLFVRNKRRRCMKALRACMGVVK